MSWFILAILSAVFWGTENFLHKLSAKKGFNSGKISTVFGITVSILSLIFFFIFKEKINDWTPLLIIALLNAVTFFTSFITRLEALKKVDASIFFPINKAVTLFVMVVISIAFLKEQLTFEQMTGLVLTILAIYLLTYTRTKKNELTLPRVGLVLILTSALFAALANFTVERLEINHIGTYSFSFFAYTFGFIFSYALARSRVLKNTTTEMSEFRDGKIIYIIGIAIGILNFGGLVFLIEALRTGPFAIVGAINNFSLLLTIGLSVMIFSERITVKQAGGIIIAFLSLFLFKM